MNYDNFEEHIHALILERGQAYFTGGNVKEIESTTDGWVLEVEGRSPYRVVLKGDKTLEDWFCECPHEHGPVCKHVAAALYAVQAQQESSLDNLLDKLSNDELKSIVHLHVRQSPHLLQELKDRFAYHHGEEE